MTKLNDRETSEDLIELGAASVETKGGFVQEIYDNPQSSRKGTLGLSAD